MTNAVSVMDRLMGWDLAYSTTFEALNNAIREHESSPKTIDVDARDNGFGKMQGTFGTWQLVADDDAVGKNIVVAIPLHVQCIEFPSGKRFADTTPDPAFSVDYVFHANVVLSFSEHKSLPSGAKVHHLKTTGPDEETLVNESVVIKSNSTNVVESAIGSTLEVWLKQNIQTFTHIFSETTTMLEDANPVYDQLMPRGLSYAVKCPEEIITQGGKETKDRYDLSRCIFSVLCRVDTETTADLRAQTDLSLVPEACDGGIAISSSVLLEKMMAPLFIAALKPQNDPTFMMSGRDMPVYSNTTDVILPDFDLSGITGFSLGAMGIKPTLKPGDLQFKISNQELRVDFLNLSFVSSDAMNRFSVNYTGRFKANLTPEGHLTLEDVSTSSAKVSITVTEAGHDYEMVANLIIQVVVSMLCLIPGAQGAAAEVEVTAEAGLAVTEEVVAETAAMSAEETALAGEEATAQLLGTVESKAATLARYGIRFGKSLGKGLLVMLAIKAVGDLPTNLAFLRDHTKSNSTPTMHDLSKRIMSVNLWNQKPSPHVVCKSAEFDNGITIGVNFLSDKVEQT
jgi:hypothetical protein